MTKSWRCFFCDEVFTNPRLAREHFGSSEFSQSACVIKAGAERSLVSALRQSERELEEAWQMLHNESSDFAKAYRTQSARHYQQIQAAEELGYERGLADGRMENTENH